MIQKLQHKFILITMTIVTILLAAIFVSLYFTSRFNYERECMEDLRNAARANDSRHLNAVGRELTPEISNAPGQDPLPRHNGEPLPDSNPTDMPDSPQAPEDNPKDRLPGEDERALMVIDQMPDGSLNVVKNQLYRFEEEDAGQLISLVNEAGTSTGVLSEQHLRYLWEPRGTEHVTRYVFADTLTEEISLRSQLTNSLIIGIIAFALFLLCSILLARRSTAPVEEAWNRQQLFVADA
ncbi:MAG: hypothetical protein LUE86_09780, partial [Clostridiales bacterium]|nr:hypothetical protein [Clostridiales bacterium]